MLGVPISPLREAIQVLEAEGLLTVMPRSGIRIVQTDLELIKNAYQLRRLLERDAVVKFTLSCQRATLDEWEQRHAELRDAADAGLDQPELGQRVDEVDYGFHFALVGALRNPIIDEVYRRNMERLVLIRLDRADAITPLLVKVSMAESDNHVEIRSTQPLRTLEYRDCPCNDLGIFFHRTVAIKGEAQAFLELNIRGILFGFSNLPVDFFI